jgi:tetratricopeptide (TPR) repeat protein
LERGVAKASSGGYDAAIADYTAAIGFNSKSTFAFLNRGLAKANLGNSSGAISDLSKAIRLDPKSAYAYDARGAEKAKSADCPGAVSDYTAAIRLDPKFALAFLNRGLAKTALGNAVAAAADYTEAIQLYNEVLSLNPNDYLARVNRAMARENTGDKSGAVEDRAKAVQIQDEVPFADFRLKAKAWREMPVKPPLPDEATRLRVLAEDAFHNKEFEKAADYYEKGLAVEPLWPPGQFNAALLDGELKLYAKAAAHMRRFLELSPDANEAKAGREKMFVWEEKAGEK